MSTATVAQGTQPIIIKPGRKIGNIIAQVTLEESHTDEIQITDHPVDRGSPISDHAFARPAELTMKLAWSNSPGPSDAGSAAPSQSKTSGAGVDQVSRIYSQLLALQAALTPVEIITGKRAYKNMLCRSISTATTVETDNSLVVTAIFRQVILVSTRTLTVSAPPVNQVNPGRTNPVQADGLRQLQAGKNFIGPIP
jgi:hypothetical protein